MKNLNDKVYKLVKQIPKGKVSTYKDIALKLNTKGYQAIGQILKNNPYAPDVPCHRVVKNNGEIGGFKGSRSSNNTYDKYMLLKKEGVIFKNKKNIDLTKSLHKF